MLKHLHRYMAFQERTMVIDYKLRNVRRSAFQPPELYPIQEAMASFQGDGLRSKLQCMQVAIITTSMHSFVFLAGDSSYTNSLQSIGQRGLLQLT